MNKKYQRYINFIADDLQTPYFENMKEMYGLRPDEYPLVLSKVYKQSVTIEGNQSVYDKQGNIIYREDSRGFWGIFEYDQYDNEIYREYSDGYWEKYQYDTNGQNEIYREDSTGNWYKWEYDANGNLIYSENSDGDIIDRR